MKRVIFTLSTVLPATLGLFLLSAGISSLSLAQTSTTAAQGSQSVQQQYIDADYVSYFTGDFIKAKGSQALDSLFKNLNYSVDTLSISSNPTLVLNNIAVSIAPKSYQVTSTQQGVAFQSLGNVATVTIGEIAVNQIVQENIGGVIANIQVTASCKGVTALLADPNSVISGELTPVQSGNIVAIQLSNPVVQLGSPQWQMFSLVCTGAQGFEQIISNTVQSSLQNSQLITSLIQQNVITSIQKIMTQMNYNWTTPQQLFTSPYKNGSGGVSAWIYPTSLKQIDANTWQSLGTARFVLPYQNNAPAQHFPLNSKVDFTQLEGQNVFAISEDAITALIQAYFAPGQWSYSGNANDLSGFNDLLQSRFLQFFLWGDLLHWPKTTQFPSVASTQTKANLTWKSNGALALKTTLKVDMDAESMPYVHFQIPFKANLQMSVVADQVVFQPKNVDVDMTYKFDAKYCAKGGTVCGSIATCVIEDSVQAYLDTQKFSFPLPKMQVVGGDQITATGFTHNSAMHSFLVVFDSN
jgi:hypothetical protein